MHPHPLKILGKIYIHICINSWIWKLRFSKLNISYFQKLLICSIYVQGQWKLIWPVRFISNWRYIDYLVLKTYLMKTRFSSWRNPNTLSFISYLTSSSNLDGECSHLPVWSPAPYLYVNTKCFYTLAWWPYLTGNLCQRARH